MININDAKRVVKRVILANLISNKKDLALTPLLVGKHGIGKSRILKELANDLGGVCITIEGGTLKEGEITGLPYQYKDDEGKTRFRFLPYYAIERIQNEEKRIFLETNNKVNENSFLTGDENKYALNDLTPEEKIKALLSKKIKPVIIFIDEFNRTENVVYKELMNILLTRSVNGYIFPWWVFFVGAMNPSTLNSSYSTNEMDPAQLDRFIKIKVSEDVKSWLSFATDNNIDKTIVDFIKTNRNCLSESNKTLVDEEEPSPSPRGWDMIDTFIKSKDYLENFFTENENEKKVYINDLKEVVYSKVGSIVGAMFMASLNNNEQIITAEEIFKDDEKLSKVSKMIVKYSPIQKVKICDLVVQYLKDNIESIRLDAKAFQKLINQTMNLLYCFDSSTKLLFAQKIQTAKCSQGTVVFDYIYQVLGDDILEILDQTDSIKDKVEGK